MVYYRVCPCLFITAIVCSGNISKTYLKYMFSKFLFVYIKFRHVNHSIDESDTSDENLCCQEYPSARIGKSIIFSGYRKHMR